jgi:hypothetical protein
MGFSLVFARHLGGARRSLRKRSKLPVLLTLGKWAAAAAELLGGF